MKNDIEKIKISVKEKSKEHQGSDKIIFYDLSIIGYLKAFSLQEYLFDQIIKNGLRGFLLLLEHYPVITLGSNRNSSNLLTEKSQLEKKGIELIQSNRGGDITFHGPGQLICYPIFDLKRFKKDLSFYVNGLEEVIIQVLSDYSIAGRRIKGIRGVFVDDRKIASIGVRVKKWITMHGFSLNVSVDLGYFENIVACGLKEYLPTSMAKIIGQDIPIDDVKEHMLKRFRKIFDISLV